MKRKTLTLTLVLLSCLALIGVGFASWIISPNKTETAEGNFSVDSVTEKNLTTKAEWCNENGAIDTTLGSVIFGYKNFSDANATNYNWLKNNNTNFEERLTLYLKVTVTDGENAVAIDIANVKVTLAETTGKYANLATEQTAEGNTRNTIVGALPTQENSGIVVSNTLGTATAETGVFYVTFTFSWGEEFEGLNPYQFYNAQVYTDNLGSKAKKMLNDLYTLLDCKFTATLIIPNN